MKPGKEVALKFLLRASFRKRRNPFLRYFWLDMTPTLLGIYGLGFVILFGGVVFFSKYVTFAVCMALVPFTYVWYKSSFRTRADERREFVEKAETLGVSTSDAEAFYDTHAKPGAFV